MEKGERCVDRTILPRVEGASRPWRGAPQRPGKHESTKPMGWKVCPAVSCVS
jgi:hypothetical protein